MIKVQSSVVITMNAPIWCEVYKANYLLMQVHISFRRHTSTFYKQQVKLSLFQVIKDSFSGLCQTSKEVEAS